MNIEQAIRAVERGWRAQPMCVYQFGEHYAVAGLNTSREVELRDARFTELIGTYKAGEESAYVCLMRDL